MNRPRYLVGTGADAAAVLRRLARDGWRTRESFALPEAAWDVSDARLVLFGRVADADAVRMAVLAAARGAGIVAVVDLECDLGRALLADLSRVGPVVRGAEEAPADELPLSDEQCQLLERLASGETIAAAAAAEYLSLRTANRRIAQARDALGVATTREAVLAYIRHRRS
ncbi:hypothetical protein [Longispora albida]|uniref:hypothetical protein n=1 Tax=Longispora albida TaxID=203523 RepID=UPI00036D79BF|nr:hypothetical protein [Longispora albida]